MDRQASRDTIVETKMILVIGIPQRAGPADYRMRRRTVTSGYMRGTSNDSLASASNTTHLHVGLDPKTTAPFPDCAIFGSGSRRAGSGRSVMNIKTRLRGSS